MKTTLVCIAACLGCPLAAFAQIDYDRLKIQPVLDAIGFHKD
jgi:hypothetical protein